MEAKLVRSVVGRITKFGNYVRLFDGARNPRKRRDDRLVWKDINFGEEYVRGRIEAVICLNPAPVGDLKGDRIFLAHRANIDRIGVELLVRRQVEQQGSVNIAEVHDGGNNSVLVRVVERVNGVQGLAATRWVDRKADKEVLGALRGCYHSTRYGFKIYPRPTEREFGVAVLCTAVDADQFPYEMIQGAPEIVDRISQDKRQFRRQLPVNCDFDPAVPCPILTLAFDDRTVRALVDEGSKGCIEITDVLLGPL